MAEDSVEAPPRYEAVVIGAGISGLCVAEQLIRDFGQDRVCVLESGDRPGGWAQTENRDGYLCDVGPNGFLDREPLMLEWVERLGLSDDLVRADHAAERRYIVKHGRLLELVGPPKFLVSPALSIPGRARLLCEPLIPKRTDDTPESIWDFAARRIGREAADTLVATMVTGVFGGDAKQLSLKHCFPRMAAMEAEYGSLFKAMKAKARAARASGAALGSPAGPGGTLTTLRGGIGRLMTRAAEVVGDSLRLHAPVASLEAVDDGFHVRLASGEIIEANSVVLATPAHAAAPIAEGLGGALASSLRSIPYAPITVVCSGYDATRVTRPLDGFGFLAPRSEGRRVLGCIWTSSVFPHAAPEGTVFLRTMFGGAYDPEVMTLDDAAMVDLLQKEVHDLVGIDGAPDFLHIYRHGKAIPQYPLTHGAVLAELDAAEARYPGLYFAGNAYRGVGLNDCVVSSTAVATRLLGERAARAGAHA